MLLISVALCLIKKKQNTAIRIKRIRNLQKNWYPSDNSSVGVCDNIEKGAGKLRKPAVTQSPAMHTMHLVWMFKYKK